MMPKKETELIHALMGRFFTIWLTGVRKLSARTVSSYRDSCRCYLKYLKETSGVSVSEVKLSHFSRENVTGFVRWLGDKGFKRATVNLRLGVLKIFAEYAMDEEPSTWEVLHGVTLIKPQRKPTGKKEIKHLTKSQLKNLLSVIDVSTKIGMRDYVLIAFCYTTGARVSELTEVRLKDLIKHGKERSVLLHGKGGKIREIPLEGTKFLKSLDTYLRLFHSGSCSENFLFYTSHHGNKTQMSRTTVDALLKKHGAKAKKKDPDLPSPLHCHMLRHSRAMHLLTEGLPLVYIRDFLGHADLSSTSIYAWTDVPTMRKVFKKIQKLRTDSFDEEEKKRADPDALALKTMGLA